jgi:hypothetical protein
LSFATVRHRTKVTKGPLQGRGDRHDVQAGSVPTGCRPDGGDGEQLSGGIRGHHDVVGAALVQQGPVSSSRTAATIVAEEFNWQAASAMSTAVSSRFTATTIWRAAI